MTRPTDRRRPASPSWMAGFVQPTTLEATCLDLEDRLNEGRPRPWADAQRLPLSELDWWSD